MHYRCGGYATRKRLKEKEKMMKNRGGGGVEKERKRRDLRLMTKRVEGGGGR